MTDQKKDPNDFDVRELVERADLRAWNLGGRERTLKIVRVAPGEVYSQEKQAKKSMPMVWLATPSGPIKKPLGLNSTNLATIGGLYGFKAKDWIGKLITIYPDKTTFGKKKNIDCIRIRPTVPRAGVVVDDLPDVPEDVEARKAQEEAARAAESEEHNG